MKKLLLLFAFAAFMVSCSKDKQVVKELEGEWKVASITYDGEAVDPENYAGDKYSFTKCNVKKDYCDGTQTTTDPDKGEVTNSFDYKIFEKGTKIEIRFSLLGFSESTISDIKEHSKSKFVMSDTDEDGVVTVTTLEKL